MNPDRPVVWTDGRALTFGQLLCQANALASQVRAAAGLINLCERRALFLTAFCAGLLNQQTTYLPASRASGVVRGVLASDPGTICVDDAVVLASLQQASADKKADFSVPPELIAALGFTSGTTGAPQRHRKIWQSLLCSSGFNAAAIRAALPGNNRTQTPWLVATVPPQHMYGFETSVLLPLVGSMAVHAGRPLFPADVAAALAEVPTPRVLVTTPVHLRALLESTQVFPQIAVVVSATAPLEVTLARAVEAQWQTRVLEMFGSTETCVIATRETARATAWTAYPGITLEPGESDTLVRAPWIETAISLQDVLEVHADGTFVVRGRHADMIEVAGKRASLAELTQRLRALDGVVDAAVFQLDAPEGGGVRRIAALVVAPHRPAEELLAEFAEHVDRAFLPRPLALVKSLPRNELGKLPRATLLESLSAVQTVDFNQ